MEFILHIFSFLKVPQLGLNVLDIIIIAVVIFYAIEGYSLGFVAALLDLLSFVVSFILALKFYRFLSGIIVVVFGMPIGFANALGFFLFALIAEIILNILSRRLLRIVPPLPRTNWFYRTLKKFDRVLGLIPGMISAFIILSFLLSIIVVLPSSPFLKRVVTNSRFGGILVANTATFEHGLNDIFGGALNDTLTFLTVKPESNETVNLHFKVSNGSIDAEAEQQMFKMVNAERVHAGLLPLTFDDKLRGLGRVYSQDMFARGYFSHYNPEGQSPFDRMEKAGITFTSAGENLALAPSTELAMQGLMNSPGHRANILSPNFGKIGIGVVDGGIYGKMFTQEFTD